MAEEQEKMLIWASKTGNWHILKPLLDRFNQYTEEMEAKELEARRIAATEERL